MLSAKDCLILSAKEQWALTDALEVWREILLQRFCPRPRRIDIYSGRVNYDDYCNRYRQLESQLLVRHSKAILAIIYNP